MAEASFSVESKVFFRFQGGIANKGQLNFYEAGRYRYAAARMLYTVEHFRTSGHVIERISGNINADFRVSAPSEGSFLETVQYFAPTLADPNVAKALLSIPFDKLFPWILDKVIPKSSTNERLNQIIEKQIGSSDLQTEATRQIIMSQQDVAIERERTSQAQIQADTERLRIMAGLVTNQASRFQENLQLSQELSTILSRFRKPQGSNDTDPDSDPAYVAGELAAEVTRAHLIADAQERLEEISPDAEQAITERVRKTMPDLGFPLRRSSDLFNIEVGNDNQRIASLNLNRIRQMTAVTRDEDAVSITGNITRLDKDSGFGRFRPNGNRSALSFSIPKEIYYNNRDAFIRSFGAPEVEIQALPFRDGIGNITRLLIVSVS